MILTTLQNSYLSFTVSNLNFVIFRYSSSISIPIKNLPSLFATNPVVPDPQNGSNIISPGCVDACIILSNKYSGFWYNCPISYMRRCLCKTIFRWDLPLQCVSYYIEFYFVLKIIFSVIKIHCFNCFSEFRVFDLVLPTPVRVRAETYCPLR